jgi:Acetyltransferase (GNAT) domain
MSSQSTLRRGAEFQGAYFVRDEAVLERSLTVAKWRSIISLGRSWEEFAKGARATWGAAPDQIRYTALAHAGRWQVLPVEFFADGSAMAHKLGQACLVRTRTATSFLAGLQLQPGVSWRDCMAAVLRDSPPGTYVYDDRWSVAPSRAAELATIPGVIIKAVTEITVHAIDLANFSSWDSYYKAISTNIKRNIKKAETCLPDLQLTTWRGQSAVLKLATLLHLRKVTFERKGITYNPLREAIRKFSSFTLAASNLVVSIASAGGKDLAFIYGYDVGDVFYYFEGGSIEDSSGASWKLLVESVKALYARAPKGIYVMGYLDEGAPAFAREGLMRQRNSLRKSDFPSAIITFYYAPPTG